MNFKNIFAYIIVTGVITALFLPFLVSNSMLFPFITGKGFTFRILVEILLGLWIIGMFYDVTIRPKFSWIMGALLSFVVIVTFADLAGVSIYRSFWSNFERMDGLITLLHMAGYFLIAGSVMNTRLRWQIFFNASVVASVIMSFYVFLQLAGKIVINQGGVRVDGTFGNATYLAVYMLFNIFIALFLLFRLYENKQNHNKIPVAIWYGAAIIFDLIVLYATATRGAILGLIGGLLFASILVAIFERERRTVRKIAIATLIVIVIVVAGFFVLRKSEIVQNSPTLGRFASLSVKELNNQGRRYVWPMAVQGFKEKPILGWGQENFNYVFNKYYDPRMYNQEQWFDRAHNIVLDWLVAGGILGLLGYFGLFFSLLFLMWKSKSLSIPEKSILTGLVSAYFFQNLFVFDNLVSYIYFFSILALIHADNTEDKKEPVWIARMVNNRLLGQQILPVLSVVLVVTAIYCINVKPIMASRALISALNNVNVSEKNLSEFKRVFDYKTFADGEASEQLLRITSKYISSNTVDVSIKQNFAKLALENMGNQTSKFSDDARYLLFMGTLYNQLGDHKNAIKYIEKAREFSPRKQKMITEIGLAQLASGDYTQALSNFKLAYDLAPEYEEARILYAIGALYAKDAKLANELLDFMGEDQYIYDERVIAAYAGTGNLAEAVRLLEKRMTLNPADPALRFRLAAGYLGLNMRTKSIEMLKEIIVLFPKNKDQAEYYIKEIQAGRNP